MTNLFQMFLRESLTEMTVIYLLVIIVIVLGAWLPYFFSQWTLYQAGFVLS
jgi:preprotein translocase subunit Sec63